MGRTVCMEVPGQNTAGLERHRQVAWPWRIGFVLESAPLAEELTGALGEMNAACAFRSFPGAPPFEIANLVERQRPDLLFVELSRVETSASEWINIVRSVGDTPLVIAVHAEPNPSEMISALRAGASEFLSLPVRPAIFEAMDRLATQLESRQRAAVAPGRMLGFLSAKGGCGATTLACYLAVALHNANGGGKSLVMDLDHQSPAAHRVFRTGTPGSAAAAFSAVRRLNSACWSEFATPVAPGVDLLTGNISTEMDLQEPWRIDSLFRFVVRNYSWVLADLGRHLNPWNWTFLENIQELFIVTAPDVLALYQTRSVLQMLTGRGFDKSRIRLVLNRNQLSPQDFWTESIEQMFEIGVFAVIPGDYPALSKMPVGRFDFPAGSPVGKAVSKLAVRIAGQKSETPKKAA